MNDIEICSLLTFPSRYKNQIKNLSVLELCDIMRYCEKRFKNNKNNWSVKLAEEFCKKNDSYVLTLHGNLSDFYIVYAKRKRKNQSFKRFLEALWRNTCSKGLLKPISRKLKLSEDADIKSFLEGFKLLKNKYLEGTDEMVIKMIYDNVETGRKISTLRNYYSSRDNS